MSAKNPETIVLLRRDRAGALLLALAAASVWMRLPALLNAGAVWSDSAIVGLQAAHILRGEWGWLIWGTQYQGTLEPALLAAAFALFGQSATTLVATTVLGHLVLVALAFVTLRRHLGDLRAAVLCLLLAVPTHPLLLPSVQPPRQWAITVLFAAVALLDWASSRRSAAGWHVLGATLLSLSLYLDLYVVQLLPAAGLFAALCCLDLDRRRTGPSPVGGRLAATALGLSLGLLPFILSRTSGGGLGLGQASASIARLSHNLALLRDQCLPWLVGLSVIRPETALYPAHWEPPALLRMVQLFGAGALALGVLLGGLLVFARGWPWPVRRLGLLGSLVAVTSLSAFLVSSVVTDIWSVRYLNAILWMAPFALAPVASALRARGLVVLVLPLLVSGAVSGWVGYGPAVSGLLPAITARGRAAEEQALGEWLRARGITHGAAQYWLAYRLTFLWKESPILVPLNPGEDRYPPYRQALSGARRIALVFHPSEPRATPETYEAQLATGGISYERAEVAGFTVLLAPGPL